MRRQLSSCSLCVAQDCPPMVDGWTAAESDSCGHGITVPQKCVISLDQYCFYINRIPERGSIFQQEGKVLALPNFVQTRGKLMYQSTPQRATWKLTILLRALHTVLLPPQRTPPKIVYGWSCSLRCQLLPDWKISLGAKRALLSLNCDT